MSDPNVYQQLGSLQAKVAALEKGQRELQRGQTDAGKKLDTLLIRSARAAAAKAMLWKIAAGAGTLGGGLVAVLAVVVQWFSGRDS